MCVYEGTFPDIAAQIERTLRGMETLSSTGLWIGNFLFANAVSFWKYCSGPIQSVIPRSMASSAVPLHFVSLLNLTYSPLSFRNVLFRPLMWTSINENRCFSWHRLSLERRKMTFEKNAHWLYLVGINLWAEKYHTIPNGLRKSYGHFR